MSRDVAEIMGAKRLASSAGMHLRYDTRKNDPWLTWQKARALNESGWIILRCLGQHQILLGFVGSRLLVYIPIVSLDSFGFVSQAWGFVLCL